MIVIEENKFFIKQYKKIIKFTQEQIEVQLIDGFVHIYGSKLEIHYFSKDEIYLAGKIRTVSFL